MDGIGIVKKTVVIRLPKFPGAEVRITVFEEIYKTIKIFLYSHIELFSRLLQNTYPAKPSTGVRPVTIKPSLNPSGK